MTINGLLTLGSFVPALLIIYGSFCYWAGQRRARNASCDCSPTHDTLEAPTHDG
jgi:hypothetical protein